MRAVSLVFPPLTEATLFPYLSLPVLAAALEADGLCVAQSDANICLLLSLMEPQILRELLEAQGDGDEPRQQVRKALIECVLSKPGLKLEITQKAPQSEEQARAIRLAKRVFDLAIEGSILGRIGLGLGNATATLKTLSAANDLVLRLIDDWITKHVESLPRNAVLGVSIPFFSQIAPVFWMCLRTRALRPDLIIVLGGPQVWLHFDELQEQICAHKLADALCFGEGEAAIVAIARLPLNFSDPPTISNTRWIGSSPLLAPRPRFDEQVPTDINASAPPVFEPSLLQKYLISEVQIPLITCVGCYWGRCSFCSYGNRYHAASLYRELRPERLEAHCVHVIERYGAQRINFVDENCNLKLIVRAMRGVRNKGHKIRFSVRNRMDKALLNQDFCHELAAMGCEFMSVGYETNSQRLLDLMDRGLDAKMFEPILQNLRAADINVRLSVMGAMPQETGEELADSVAFLSRVSSYVGIDSAQKLIAEPMTYMITSPSRYGVTRLNSNLTDFNRELGFGMGRVGHSFDSTSEVTESDFSKAVRTIRPSGNDEKRPVYDSDIHATERVRVIRLLPHAFAAPYGEDHLIVGDLSWQDFRKVPIDTLNWQGGAEISATSPRGENVLKQLIRAGIAELI